MSRAHNSIASTLTTPGTIVFGNQQAKEFVLVKANLWKQRAGLRSSLLEGVDEAEIMFEIQVNEGANCRNNTASLSIGSLVQCEQVWSKRVDTSSLHCAYTGYVCAVCDPVHIFATNRVHIVVRPDS